MEELISQVSKIIKEEGFLSLLSKAMRYINKNICGVSKAIIFELDLEKPFKKSMLR